MTQPTTNEDGHLIDPNTQRKILPTSPLKGGLVSATAEITKVSDSQRCQMTVPCHVVPIVFVPGIMGSNLVGAATEDGQEPDGFAWNPNDMLGMAGTLINSNSPDDRQKRLNPVTTKVLFDIPKIPSTYKNDLLDLFGGCVSSEEKDQKKRETVLENIRLMLQERGWGTVMYDSYWPILMALQRYLNPKQSMTEIQRFKKNEAPAAYSDAKTKGDKDLWSELLLDKQNGFNSIEGLHCVGGKNQPKDLLADEVEHALSYCYPVHAAGYNWLRTNYDSANGPDKWSLKQTVERIIAENQKIDHECNKVIIVTHSMGGLVARAYCKENQDKVHGVIHGVMPATGAPPMYKRMRAGFGGVETEQIDGFTDKLMGGATAMIMGGDGYKVTAVLASCVGALELAPTMDYGRTKSTVKQWLRIKSANTPVLLPKSGDPYKEIYLSDQWYGLIPQYAPDNGADGRNQRINPAGLDLGMEDRIFFAKNIDKAKLFHKIYMPYEYYHPNSYVSYLAQGKAYETVTWEATGGTQRSPVGSSDGGWRTESGAELSTEAALDAAELNPITGENIDDFQLSRDGRGGDLDIERERQTQNYKVLKQEGKGDGTVPEESGQAPKEYVQAIFEQGDAINKKDDHQSSWNVPAAQRMALLAVCKIIKDDHRAKS